MSSNAWARRVGGENQAPRQDACDGDSIDSMRALVCVVAREKP